MAPVTDTLSKVMAQTFAVLKAIDTRGNTNDKDHYAEVATQLEELTVAILSASSSLPLIGVRPTGARFDIGAGTTLAEQVTACSEYLREDASALLLRASRLSAYESKNVTVAVDLLRGLYGTIKTAITTQARVDLTALSNAGSDNLVQAATLLAELAEAATKRKVK